MAATSALVMLLLAGCATRPAPILEFPQNRGLTKSLSKEDVTIVLELEGDHDDFSVRPERVTPRAPSVTEFDFGSGHRVLFRYKNVVVGESRYPARNGEVFVFLEREGTWSFRYRGREVRVERRGRWKPSLYFRQVEVADRPSEDPRARGVPVYIQHGSRGVMRVKTSTAVKYLEHEEVRVGDHVIIVRPADLPAWTIDGERVVPRQDAVIVLEESGEVRLE